MASELAARRRAPLAGAGRWGGMGWAWALVALCRASVLFVSSVSSPSLTASPHALPLRPPDAASALRGHRPPAAFCASRCVARPRSRPACQRPRRLRAAAPPRAAFSALPLPYSPHSASPCAARRATTHSPPAAASRRLRATCMPPCAQRALRCAHGSVLAGWAEACSAATGRGRARGARSSPRRAAGGLSGRVAPGMPGGCLLCSRRRAWPTRTRCPVSRSLPARCGGTGPTLR